MSRRFQFSLKALMMAMLVLCAVLSVRRFYLAHFANYVALETTKVGQPIRVSGQFFQRGAANSTVFMVRVVHHGPNGKSGAQTKGRAERTGIGTYRFDLEFPPQRYWAQPSEVDLYLTPLDGQETVGRGVVE